MSGSKWNVGDKVVVYVRRDFTYSDARIATVDKVYKNGNIIVAERQYRPSGYGAGNNPYTIERYTPEIGDKMASAVSRRRRLNRISSLSGRMALIWRKGIDIPERTIAAIEALLDEAEAKS